MGRCETIRLARLPDHRDNRQRGTVQTRPRSRSSILGAQETTFDVCGGPDESIAFTSSDRAAVPPEKLAHASTSSAEADWKL
jgi:hypothetical protein